LSGSETRELAATLAPVFAPLNPGYRHLLNPGYRHLLNPGYRHLRLYLRLSGAAPCFSLLAWFAIAAIS
jgi:hypothetical protein